MENIYYVYEDDDHELYYYNCQTEEATYDKPESATFLDPDTNQPYVFPKKNKANKADDKNNDNETNTNIEKVKEQNEPSNVTKSESDQETTPKKTKKVKKDKKDKKVSDTESEKELESPKSSKKKKKEKKHKKSDLESEPDSEHKNDDNDKKVKKSNVVTDNEKDIDSDSPPNENIPVYFVYFDEEKKELYYFDTKTKKTTYDKPEIGEFLDPDTNEPFNFDVKEKRDTSEEESKPKKKSKKSDLESDNDTPKKNKKTKESESSSSSHSESDSESSDDNLETYFVYLNEQSNRIYYYNAETKETTYDKPENARFLDPKTSKKYVFSDTEKTEKKKKKKGKKKEKKEKKEKKSKREKKEKNQSDAEAEEKNQADAEAEENNQAEVEAEEKKDDLPPTKKAEEKPNASSETKSVRFSESQSVVPTVKRRSDTVPMKKNKSHKSAIDVDMIIDVPREVTKFEYTPEVQRPRSQSFLPDAEKLALPSNLQEDIHKFQVDAYAKQFFKEHRVHHIFSRKKISPEDLAAFQDTPLTASLLGSVPKNLQKESIQCFNYILNYSGATKDKIKNTSLTSLVSLIDKYPILRDEVFFQLVKQTNNNSNEDVLLRTYQIFLVCASIFPSSRDSEVWIKSHLSREAMVQKNKEIRDYAQFTYIRFNTRCTIGKPLEIAPMFVSKLAKDVYESKQVFHASIYEQLWNQRTTFKLFPVPIIVHTMADMLIQKGAEKTEGIFRIVGNKKIVTNMQEKVNKGGEIDPNIAIHDLASLFKSWFSTLPDTLIPESCLPDLINANEDKKYIEFTEKLPKAHFYTLKYLIGFFQKLVKSEEETKMNASNLAICFGPDVISTRHVKDLSDFEKFKKMSINLLTALIDGLPTNDIYPLELGL